MATALPGAQGIEVYFERMWKVFAHLQVRKNLPHSLESAPQARGKQQHSDFSWHKNRHMV